MGWYNPPNMWFYKLGELLVSLCVTLKSFNLHNRHMVRYVALIVYVDNILAFGSDLYGLKRWKQTKDLELLRYFLSIEVAYSKKV